MTPERKKKLWTEIVRIVVNAIVALTTALTATSCMYVNKNTEQDKQPIVITQPSKSSNYGE